MMKIGNRLYFVKKYGLTLISTYSSGNTIEWKLSDEEKSNIIETVNSNYYFRYLLIEKYESLTNKKVKTLIRKRNKMVISRIFLSEKSRREKIVLFNLKNLELYDSPPS